MILTLGKQENNRDVHSRLTVGPSYNPLYTPSPYLQSSKPLLEFARLPWLRGVLQPSAAIPPTNKSYHIISTISILEKSTYRKSRSSNKEQKSYMYDALLYSTFPSLAFIPRLIEVHYVQCSLVWYRSLRVEDQG